MNTLKAEKSRIKERILRDLVTKFSISEWSFDSAFGYEYLGNDGFCHCAEPLIGLELHMDEVEKNEREDGLIKQ